MVVFCSWVVYYFFLELFPLVATTLVKQLLVILFDLILVQLVVIWTVLAVAHCSFPTLELNALFVFDLGFCFLTEIQLLNWSDLIAKCFLEVWVANFPVLVDIKAVVDLIEFFVWHGDAPVIEVVPQFAFTNAPSFFAQVVKSLANRCPLLIHFLFNHFEAVTFLFKDILLQFVDDFLFILRFL